MIREINYQELEGIKIGCASDEVNKTGVTVVMFENGATGGVDISGGGPASRETPLLDPLTADNPINALVLSGGSAYGLASAGGVMKYLEERNIGFETGFAKVPLVVGSCIYDLSYGSPKVRPDEKMGYEACIDAQKNQAQSGNFGAGCGATVGKIAGMKQAMKSGMGICGMAIGELKMVAIVIVNALGDIFEYKTGKKIAGLMNKDRDAFSDTFTEVAKMMAPTNLFTGNTTIGAIITNGKFDKGNLGKIASMTRNGYARSINPVGTLADGDSIYAFSVGDVNADINLVGTMGAELMSKAIEKAVLSSVISDEEYLLNVK